MRVQFTLSAKHFLISLPQCFEQKPTIDNEFRFRNRRVKIMLDTDCHFAALDRNDLPVEFLVANFDLGWRIIHHDQRAFDCKNVNEEFPFSPIEPPIVN